MNRDLIINSITSLIKENLKNDFNVYVVSNITYEPKSNKIISEIYIHNLDTKEYKRYTFTDKQLRNITTNKRRNYVALFIVEDFRR